MKRTFMQLAGDKGRAAVSRLPAPPCMSDISVAPLPVEVFAGIREKLLASERRRDEIHAHHRDIVRMQAQAVHMLAYGFVEKAEGLTESILETIRAMPANLLQPPPDRDGRISQVLQRFIAIVAQLRYYETARLVEKRDIESLLTGIHVADSEYLIGVIGFIEELSGYGLRRATHGDVHSVALSRDLAEKMLELLMQFNFRNDGLRQRYDSVKWNVRRLNELLYNLSTVGPHSYAEVGSSGLYGGEVPCINAEEIKEIQSRIEEFDKARELVLQGARGKAQKLAKHSIFALQRGDLEKGEAQLNEAIEVAQATYDEHISGRYPALRSGAFGDCMEEIAESAIFLGWLRTGCVPTPDTVPLLSLDEYLGGLIDFTGEVGRYAVLNATKRDVGKVNQCFAVALAVTEQVALLPTDGRLGKKLDALKSNTKKIESLLFDLSMSKGKARPE